MPKKKVVNKELQKLLSSGTMNRTAIYINSAVWKEFKIHATRIGKPMSKLLEELIIKELNLR